MNLDALAVPGLLTAEQVAALKRREQELTSRADLLAAVHTMMRGELSRGAIGAAAHGATGALTALRRAEAISGKSAQRLAPLVAEGPAENPLYLVMLAGEYERRDDWWSPENIAAFLAELRRSDLLDAAAQKRIEATQAAGGLAS